jgi:hypothetical protein
MLRSYLQSGLKHKFLISDAYHLDILYEESRNVEIPGCLWNPKGVRERKSFRNTDVNLIATGLRAVTYGDRITVRKRDVSLLEKVLTASGYQTASQSMGNLVLCWGKTGGV